MRWARPALWDVIENWTMDEIAYHTPGYLRWRKDQMFLHGFKVK